MLQIFPRSSIFKCGLILKKGVCGAIKRQNNRKIKNTREDAEILKNRRAKCRGLRCFRLRLFPRFFDSESYKRKIYIKKSHVRKNRSIEMWSCRNLSLKKILVYVEKNNIRKKPEGVWQLGIIRPGVILDLWLKIRPDMLQIWRLVSQSLSSQ